MDTVILAAGFGSRLASHFEPKPLAPVCGVPLLEIGVRQAVLAGSDHVVIVTGYRADAIEAEIPAMASRTGARITSQRVEDWSKPNGYSVIAGAAQIDGPFLLMMADHLLSGGILPALTQQSSPARGVTLAVDRRLDNPLVDPEDATWVRTDDHGFIEAIGKTIAPFNAVDCGAFLATPELPEAIAEAIAAGKPGSLSDGMQILADKGRAATMDIGNDWWLDVDDPRAHRLAQDQAAGEIAWLGAQATAGMTGTLAEVKVR